MAVARIAAENLSSETGQVPGLNYCAANGKTMQFLQYASGSDYLRIAFWNPLSITHAGPTSAPPLLLGGSEILRLSEAELQMVLLPPWDLYA